MAGEKLFENKVKKWLKSNNIWYFKVWGSMFQKAGVPDILACVGGRFVALEIKDEKGKPSKLQEYVISEINKSGGYARFVYPSDYDELTSELQALLPSSEMF